MQRIITTDYKQQFQTLIDSIDLTKTDINLELLSILVNRILFQNLNFERNESLDKSIQESLETMQIIVHQLMLLKNYDPNSLIGGIWLFCYLLQMDKNLKQISSLKLIAVFSACLRIAQKLISDFNLGSDDYEEIYGTNKKLIGRAEFEILKNHSNALKLITYDNDTLSKFLKFNLEKFDV